MRGSVCLRVVIISLPRGTRIVLEGAADHHLLGLGAGGGGSLCAMRHEQEISRERNAALLREAFEDWAEAPRDPVLLPFVDTLAEAPVGADFPPNGFCNGCPAAKIVDEVRVSLHKASIRNPFGVVKRDRGEPRSDDFPQGVSDNGRMAPRVKNPEAIAAGDRLRRTRDALGLKRRRMAQFLDEDEDKLEKWESGFAMVPPYFVRKLGTTYGITYEWIYDGNSAKLPHDLALKLIERTNDAAE